MSNTVAIDVFLRILQLALFLIVHMVLPLDLLWAIHCLNLRCFQLDNLTC